MLRMGGGVVVTGVEGLGRPKKIKIMSGTHVRLFVCAFMVGMEVEKKGYTFKKG